MRFTCTCSSEIHSPKFSQDSLKIECSDQIIKKSISQNPLNSLILRYYTSPCASVFHVLSIAGATCKNKSSEIIMSIGEHHFD